MRTSAEPMRGGTKGLLCLARFIDIHIFEGHGKYRDTLALPARRCLLSTLAVLCLPIASFLSFFLF